MVILKCILFPHLKNSVKVPNCSMPLHEIHETDLNRAEPVGSDIINEGFELRASTRLGKNKNSGKCMERMVGVGKMGTFFKGMDKGESGISRRSRAKCMTDHERVQKTVVYERGKGGVGGVGA